MQEHTQPDGSRAEREAAELIHTLLEGHPFPEAPQTDITQREHEGVYRVESPAARSLNCVAIVRNGTIIPIVDLESAPEPHTPGEKMHFFALTARTILDGLMDALLFWETRRRDREDEEGGTCHA